MAIIETLNEDLHVSGVPEDLRDIPSDTQKSRCKSQLWRHHCRNANLQQLFYFCSIPREAWAFPPSYP